MNKKNVACTNRKAFHDYNILETYEAGISLKGYEVKSLRSGLANLRDSYARIGKNEIMLYNMHISPYARSDARGINPLRVRKLLLHRREITRLMGKVFEKGLTLVPLEIYFKRGNAKLTLALAKGKKSYDKKEAIKKKDIERETGRILRGLKRTENRTDT